MNLKIPLAISTVIALLAMLVSLKVFMGVFSSEHTMRIFLASVGLAIFSFMFICCSAFLVKELFSSKKR